MGNSDTYLVFGGPYSNLEALEAIRDVARSREIAPDRVICTGDMVAYCADPEETVRACRDWGIHIVQGNCEEQLALGADDCGCGFEEGSTCSLLARSWYEHANSVVSLDARSWMGQLPKTYRFTVGGLKVCVFHGSLERNNEFIFPSTSSELKARIQKAAAADIVIAGHSGIPFIEWGEGGIWFNPGVIGMPANDGTADGWYGLIECDENGVSLSTHRLPYDAERASQKLTAAGFADDYAKALLTGLWPSTEILPDDDRDKTGLAIEECRLSVSGVALEATL